MTSMQHDDGLTCVTHNVLWGCASRAREESMYGTSCVVHAFHCVLQQTGCPDATSMHHARCACFPPKHVRHSPKGRYGPHVRPSPCPMEAISPLQNFVILSQKTPVAKHPVSKTQTHAPRKMCMFSSRAREAQPQRTLWATREAIVSGRKHVHLAW